MTTDKFWQQIMVVENGCWLWTRAADPLGYGRVQHNGRVQLAHRVAYELTYGPVPEGMDLDHLCRFPPCVRPQHLEAVTHQVNMRRGKVFNDEICRRGHLRTYENTWHGKGRRFCLVCREIQWVRRGLKTSKVFYFPETQIAVSA